MGVRALLESRPDLVQALGTRAADLEQVLIEKGSGGLLLQEEQVRAELKEVRATLREDGDGAAEQLLIEHAALSWLALTTAQIARELRRTDGVFPAYAEAWDRHVSHLQTEFLRAVKTLAAVRRLRLPAMQVNVGRQQVNIAG
jgi:hypothetical protein